MIEKEIRDRLGVRPGWRTLQLLVGDHVEIHFLPPEHERSLAGFLSGYARGRGAGGVGALRDAREAAWGEAARRRMADGDATEGPGRAG